MAELPEICGAGISLHPDQFPFIQGVSIEKQPSMPVISGISVGFPIRKKPIIITDLGALLLHADSKKIAISERGLTLNLNQNNPNNIYYQLL